MAGSIGAHVRRRIISRQTPQPYATSVGVERGAAAIDAATTQRARFDPRQAASAIGHHTRRIVEATWRALER